MKAAILTHQKRPLVVDDISLPDTLDYGQVLVRVNCSGICGAQINEIDGTKGPDKFLPHLLGHEGGGVVESVGAGVSTVKRGDRVVMHWRKGDGIQSAPPKYSWGKKIVNAGWVTTFNEMAVVSENRVTKIPDDFSLKDATLYGCALTTAHGVIHSDGRGRVGDSLVVYGSGGVGASLVLMGRLAGLYPIIAIDINPWKLKAVKPLGATYVVNGKKIDAEARVKKLLPQGADIVVDTTGIAAIRETSYRMTSPSGTTVLVGVPKSGEEMKIDSFPLHFEKRITGSHGGDSRPDIVIPRLVRLQQSGAFATGELITHSYSLDKINDAIDMVRHGNTLRCVIQMST